MPRIKQIFQCLAPLTIPLVSAGAVLSLSHRRGETAALKPQSFPLTRHPENAATGSKIVWKSTPEQAVQAAREFCRAIGEPVPASESGWYLKEKPDWGFPDRNWQPSWRVSFTGQRYMNVSDSSLIVWRYVHDSVSSPSGHSDRIVPKDQALNLTGHALAASGLPMSSFGPRTASEHLPPPPDRPGFKGGETSHFWDINLHRMFRGIPYSEQDVQIQVEAETGKLAFFIVRFDGADPSSTSPQITKSQAETVAAAELKKYRIDDPKFTDRLVIAQHLDLDSLMGKEGVRPPENRLAWECRCSVPYKYGRTGWKQVSVDAQSGQVVDSGGSL